MAKVCYIEKRFSPAVLGIIDAANQIIAEYRKQGYSLTLRQLYYQFIARDLFPDSWIDVEYNRKHNLPDDTKNTQKNYSRLGGIINNGRLAGEIDWNAIEDRTRNLVRNSHWTSPGSIIKSAADGYAIDKWKNQDHRLEVWVEKEALSGVFDDICSQLDVPFFACRGYVSQSEMWRAAQRMVKWERGGQRTVVLHFGDHDPSGLDMTRDIQDRFNLFGAETQVVRMALTWDQIQLHNPPPNPAKGTDARFKSYQEEFGDESWELDALEPPTLVGLVQDGVFDYRDPDRWGELYTREESERAQLQAAADEWDDIVENLDWEVPELPDDHEVPNIFDEEDEDDDE
jgi:hypothetical protein